MENVEIAVAAGDRAPEVAGLLGVRLTSLQCWRRQFAADGDGLDGRNGIDCQGLSYRLSEEERKRILLTCNESEFAVLPSGQIVPILVGRSLSIGSERSFFRGYFMPMDRPSPWPCSAASAASRVATAGTQGPIRSGSWDITYLPTNVRGVWLYLYLVIDVCSRKVAVWDVPEREDPAIAADLVSRACIRVRIGKGRTRLLILHSDNGNAMRAATAEGPS